MPTPNLALARPTVNLPGGLRPGFWYWVDLDSPYVQTQLDAQKLVLAEEQPPGSAISHLTLDEPAVDSSAHEPPDTPTAHLDDTLDEDDLADHGVKDDDGA